MSTLILVEHHNQSMHSSTRNTLAAALEFGEPIILLVVGFQCKSVAQQAAVLAGVDVVWYLDKPCYEHLQADQLRALIGSLSGSFKTLLVPASSFGKNLAPGIAAGLDIAQVSEVIKIIDGTTFEHPIYAGNAIETVRVLDPVKVISVRTSAFNPVITTQEACAIEVLDKEFVSKRSYFIRHELSQSKRPDLGSAKIVVSGGRGLRSAEHFKLIEELADVLGAAVGASRAAVDAGFVSNECQVGQTGKVIAPMLYIAVGISGAIQHLSGIKGSKIIVAINKDINAPIFKVADYVMVGDLFELVPQLIEQLKKLW